MSVNRVQDQLFSGADFLFGLCIRASWLTGVQREQGAKRVAPSAVRAASACFNFIFRVCLAKSGGRFGDEHLTATLISEMKKMPGIIRISLSSKEPTLVNNGKRCVVLF